MVGRYYCYSNFRLFDFNLFININFDIINGFIDFLFLLWEILKKKVLNDKVVGRLIIWIKSIFLFK